MTSLLLRNLIYTILQPGVVAGLVPYLIVRRELKTILSNPFGFTQWIGIVLMMIGLAMLLICVYFFAKYGRGTLSPVDPTKKLVITGLYRYTRNPMYMSVLTILLGETLFMKSLNLGMYTIFIALAFYLFVAFHEEPYLQRQFGNEYSEYKKKVRRWI